jgi:hypothetical protein
LPLLFGATVVVEDEVVVGADPPDAPLDDKKRIFSTSSIHLLDVPHFHELQSKSDTQFIPILHNA